MSPGATMARVYDTLKARIMAGEFAPGERLDPYQLAPGLASSPTPVREALHRLAGERLVESWQQEGFRQPHIVEPAIRDLYEWSGELMHVVLRAASNAMIGFDLIEASPPQNYVARVADMLLGIAQLSPNHEHRHAVTSLNERSALFRTAEHRVLPDAQDDLTAVEAAVAEARWSDAGRALDQFHRRRLRVVGAIAGMLRSRPAGVR